MKQKRRIAAGIALLDKKVPGWCKRVDLKTLDLRNIFKCTLGQVYKKSAQRRAKRLPFDYNSDGVGYYQGLRCLKIKNTSEAVALGFDCDNYVEGHEETYFSLTCGWKKAIRVHCHKV